MNQNTEKIKIGLLAIIAVTLIVQTFYLANGNGNSDPYAAPANNMIATEGEEVAPVAAVPKTTLKFKETEHNFGKINQNTENKKIFTFTNTGENPLTISNAVGSCGCTVPTWPKDPIAPGATGEIVVVYSPGTQVGSQSKTVTVTGNTEPLSAILTIRADVQEAADH